MADALIGKWNYDSVENLEAYMDAMGVPDQMKEMAKNSKPIVEISKEGDVWVIKTTVGDKITETKYPENQEIETINLMGKPMKATLKVGGGGLVENQKVGDIDMTIERSVENGLYVAKMTANGVEAKVKFTKA